MPWSNQSGGGGWKGGGGGPWGPRPGGSGQQPDLEEILRRSQDRIRQAMPGGRMGGPFLALAAVVLIALVGFFGFTVRVNPEELGIVLRFGQYVRQLPPGLNFRWPYPIEQVELPKVTRVNRIEIGMRGSSDSRDASSTIRDVPEESLMLTGDENIVDVDFVVFWRIANAPDYLFNIENPEGTVKDVAESAMREVVGQGDIQPILTEARAKTEFDVQTADAEDPRFLRRRRAGHPGAAAEGRSARSGDRRLPRRAGRPRRPGASAERGASLRQPHRAGGQGRGRAHPASRPRLSRPGHRRGQGRGRPLHQRLRPVQEGARGDAQAHLHRDHGKGAGRHQQGDHRRQGGTGRRALSAAPGIVQADAAGGGGQPQ